MLFRNLMMFRIPPASVGVNALDKALPNFPLRDPGPLELRVAGFVPPCEHAQGLVYSTAGSDVLVCLGVNERILPSRVVADALDKKEREIRAKEQRFVGKKERARLKEQVLAELAPRAFVRRTLTRAYIDAANGWVVVDTASRKNAEWLVGSVRQALGSFPAFCLATRLPMRVQFTDWLTRGEAPALLEFGDECELRDAGEGGKWVGRNVDLLSNEVGEHLSAGKQAVRLGMRMEGDLQFVLGEDLTVRKAKFEGQSQSDNQPSADGNAFASAFVQMTLQVRKLQKVFEESFGLYSVQDGQVGAKAPVKKPSAAEQQTEFEFGTAQAA
jgi:recombination associated protein RdgC